MIRIMRKKSLQKFRMNQAHVKKICISRKMVKLKIISRKHRGIMKEYIDKIRQRRSTLPQNVTLDNETIADKKDIVEKLNKFFTKNAPSLDNKIVAYFEIFEKIRY